VEGIHLSDFSAAFSEQIWQLQRGAHHYLPSFWQ
jgi:hypothetical protein